MPRLLAPLVLLLAGCPTAAPPAADDDDQIDDDDAADDDCAVPDDDDATPPDDDDSALPDDDDAVEVIHEYSCSLVGSGLGDGFFSLRGFGGHLYAGEFGYGLQDSSMVWRYAPWELTSPGLLGISESVCAMLEFDGLLYANTESDGDIYRTADGSTWERVWDGPAASIGCGLEVFGGHLYAVNYSNQSQTDGRILRSADGASWETVWDSGDSSWYVREIVAFGGELRAYFLDQDQDQPYQATSVDGSSWTVSATPTRFFRGYVHEGSLWLGSTDRGGGGVAGVWRDDGDGYELVYAADKRYVTEIVAWDGALFAGTSDGWKEDVGTSALLMSRDGSTWEQVCAFDEIAIWSVAVADGSLFAGTWQWQAGGQVHRVDITEVPRDDSR